MNRRQFLTRALLAAPLIAVPTALARTYFLPPSGGWPDPRLYYLVNQNAVYYFSAPTQSYIELLASGSIPRFGGKWVIQREPPRVVNPCAELRTTYRTFQREVEQTYCIAFDGTGNLDVETEERDVPQRIAGPVTMERIIEARAVDGSFNWSEVL